LDDNRARPFIQSRFDLGGRWPSRLVATAEEDRLSFTRHQQRPTRKKPRQRGRGEAGIRVSRGVTRDASNGNGHPLSAQPRGFWNSIGV